jgi:hypothetical protein
LYFISGVLHCNYSKYKLYRTNVLFGADGRFGVTKEKATFSHSRYAVFAVNTTLQSVPQAIENQLKVSANVQFLYILGVIVNALGIVQP